MLADERPRAPEPNIGRAGKDQRQPHRAHNESEHARAIVKGNISTKLVAALERLRLVAKPCGL